MMSASAEDMEQVPCRTEEFEGRQRCGQQSIVSAAERMNPRTRARAEDMEQVPCKGKHGRG